MCLHPKALNPAFKSYLCTLNPTTSTPFSWRGWALSLSLSLSLSRYVCVRACVSISMSLSLSHTHTHTVGLEDWVPEEGKYDVIWVQWVVGHLTDDDFVAFFQVSLALARARARALSLSL